MTGVTRYCAGRILEEEPRYCAEISVTKVREQMTLAFLILDIQVSGE